MSILYPNLFAYFLMDSIIVQKLNTDTKSEVSKVISDRFLQVKESERLSLEELIKFLKDFESRPKSDISETILL